MGEKESFIHVRNIEKYHPGYKDRHLCWAKIRFDMVQGDPDCEMIESEIDWARLIKFILLELQAKKPLPLKNEYLQKKGFDLKKRPISLTLQMLHNFVDVVTQDSKVCVLEKSIIEKNRIEKSKVEKKDLFLDFVYLTKNEHEKLIKKFGDKTDGFIKTLNRYGHTKPKKFKEYGSHYYVILEWNKDKVLANKVDNDEIIRKAIEREEREEKEENDRKNRV